MGSVGKEARSTPYSVGPSVIYLRTYAPHDSSTEPNGPALSKRLQDARPVETLLQWASSSEISPTVEDVRSIFTWPLPQCAVLAVLLPRTGGACNSASRCSFDSLPLRRHPSLLDLQIQRTRGHNGFFVTDGRPRRSRPGRCGLSGLRRVKTVLDAPSAPYRT
ncbi:hypothetical protein VTN00DRAFT_1958 [Thermoascus crustaceus]|uniref:uncharacterized protein n=1 Tax=Thermoascus crustaceus TaxID=5088 RepID=UPI0037436BC9